MKQVSTEKLLRVYVVGSSIAIALLIIGLVVVSFTLFKVNDTVNYLQTNLPESSCGATDGDNVITCQ